MQTNGARTEGREIAFVAEFVHEPGGDLGRCLEFLDAAAELGCRGVRFQQLRLDRAFAPAALGRDPRLLRRRGPELPESLPPELATRARARGLTFASTPHYLEAVPLLEPWVDSFRVSTYHILWNELLTEVARTQKPVVLGTGMANLSEVKAAVDVLWNGGCRDLLLLHSVSSYPVRPFEANLAAMGTLRQAFGAPVGWADRTVDPGVVLRAIHRWEAAQLELQLDLFGDGEELVGGPCWLPEAARRVIAKSAARRREGEMSPLDGTGHVTPGAGEITERGWRADPADGLRPLREIRSEW